MVSYRTFNCLAQAKQYKKIQKWSALLLFSLFSMGTHTKFWFVQNSLI